MSLKCLLDKVEAFNNTFFPEIENLKNSSEIEMEVPKELKAQISLESESLLMNFICYSKNLDKYLYHYKETSTLSKELEEIRLENNINQEKIIQASNSLDDLFYEVKMSMKEIK